MKSTQLAIFLSTVILLGLGSSVRAAEQVTAKSFADPSGNLDQQRAAMYIVYRDMEPLSKFMAPGQTTLDPQRVVDAMAEKLDDLRSKTGHEAPWTWQELDLAFPPKKTDQEADAELPAWKKINGLTKKKAFGKESKVESLGPVMLRKSAADLTKSLSNAKGATLAYSRNDLKGGDGALNSQGVLDYPTMWNLYQGGYGRSIEMGFDFASEWNVAQVQEDRKKDLEELTFSTPITFYVSPGAWLTRRGADADGASSSLLLIQGKPYFQTDFGFRHEIYGVEATAEFVGNLFGSRVLALGGFQNTGLWGFQYQWRLIPKLDYSVTERGGIHTTRKEGDDWFRLGGTASLDLRLGLQTFNALDAGVSYQFLETVSGSGGYSHLFKAYTTLWLIENAGLTLEYSKGDTPVANKPIDLITLGLEFKY
jgi:hypothetical protein